MSLSELRECSSELEACNQELEEAERRLGRCQEYRDNLDILVEALEELPDRIYDYLTDKYGSTGVSPGDIEDAIRDILSIYGVDLEGKLIEKRFGYYEPEEGERIIGWVSRYGESASREEIERELSYCLEELESCRDRISRTIEEAEECEALVEEREEVAEEIARDLPYLLAEEIARRIEESDYVTPDVSQDLEEIAGFIEEELEEHYYSKL